MTLVPASRMLLALLLAGLSLAATKQLHCPDLSASLVCAVADSGFGFNDGCNDVTCTGDGRASTTLMACRAPETADERRTCDRLAISVWRLLGPFDCPNVDPAAVCADRGQGFAFSDGCNAVRCLGGSHVSTRMSCRVADPEGPFCRHVAAAIVETTEPQEPRTGAVVESQFQCPALHYSRVCAEYLPSFTYDDGCRMVTCVSRGLARNHAAGGRDCPEPRPGDSAAAAYCDEAERRMLAKKAQSSFHTTCLNGDTVCRSVPKSADIAFFDGCNRCFCLPDRTAACTRAACVPRFVTPEEFSEHCVRARAGVLSQRRK